MEVVAIDGATLHHEDRTLQHGDVLEWIARDGDNICPLAGVERADTIAPAHQLSGIYGGGAQSVGGCHAEVAHVDLQLMRVEAMRIDRSVGAHRDLHSFGDGMLRV